MSFGLFGYGLLARQSIVGSSDFASDAIFFPLMIVWMALAIVQFVTKSETAFDAAWRLISYHILGIIYLLFVTGFAMPLITCWVMMALASYAFFSNLGLRLNVLVFLSIATVDSMFNLGDQMTLVQNLLSAAAVLTVTLVAISLTRVQETDSRELTRSRSKETRQRDSILTLINNLADAVVSTDKNGVVQIYNAASLNLLDTNDALSGKRLDDIVNLATLDGKNFKLFDTIKRSHGVTVIDDVNALIGNDSLRFEITFSPIRSSFKKSTKADNEDGYIVIMRDITKSKSLEEERDEFISVVSHELRTPLAIAEGTISNAQLMFERDDINDKKLKDGLGEAHQQVIFLSSMVNDLSTLSRAERGVSDEAEMIDVKELVSGLFGGYNAEAEEKGLHFNLDAKGSLGMVFASRLYLHELLQNFITNAIKYTKTGSVTLSAMKIDGEVVFAVKDTGIGISKSDQAKIFKKFYRSEDYRTRETGGTGIGLYVSLKLAKKLGCEIKVDSRINHGTTFSFSLPAAKPDSKSSR